MMNQEIKQRWIEALRSGEYQQGKKSLFHCGKFCCLGVLTDLYIKEHGLQWNKDSAVYYGDIEAVLWSFEGEGGTLPRSVQKWSGIDAPNPTILGDGATDHNDNYHLSFNEIAALIEEDKEL
jgi:hypothetical protein